jgi:amino acid efflux transporter
VAAQRGLGAVQVTALYVGAVLGTGVLVLPAIAAETAGPASLIAWGALVALSIPMALTYAAMSRQRPDAAGFSDAIERAFGPRWGAVSGWVFLAQVPTGYVVAGLIAGSSAASAFGLGRDASFLLAGALLAVVFAVNALGLRVSATAQTIAVGVIVLAILVIIVRALPRVDGTAFTPFFAHGTLAIGAAAVQLFWAFVGWEAITPLAADVRRPSDIWRATLLAVLIVGAFYLALAFVTIGTRAYGSAGSGDVPLVGLAADTFGPLAGIAVGIGAFAISFPVVNAYTAGISRMAAALGRRRALPPWVGELTPSGLPMRALAVLTVANSVALVVAYIAGWRIADLLPLSTSSFIATYVLSMAAALRLLRGPLRIGAAISLVACLVVLAFTGALVAWIVGVTLLSLWYTRSLA